MIERLSEIDKLAARVLILRVSVLLRCSGFDGLASKPFAARAAEEVFRDHEDNHAVFRSSYSI